MKNQDFSTALLVDATPQEVFDAVNNVRGWWSENIEGETDRQYAEFCYHYEDVHRCKIKITELLPGKKVVWKVLDNYFKFTEEPGEWIGTNVIFDISEEDGKTRLVFTHLGLVPAYECFQICRDAWTHYIQESLKGLILTGVGSPTPANIKNEITEMSLLHEHGSATQPIPGGIHHRLLINAPVEIVYKALTTRDGLAGWWTPETEAKPEVGSIARFTFGSDYFKEMKVEELRPYSNVKWRCLKGYESWIGTIINFVLEPHRQGCWLLLGHEGWREYTPGFAECSYDWAMFLRSLKILCETGTGLPYPDQYR